MVQMLFLDQRKLGFIIIAIGIILLFVVYSSTQYIMRLNTELHKGCNLPEGICPYTRSIPQESVHGFTIVAALLVIGSFMALSSKQIEKVSFRDRTKIRETLKSLAGEEKQIYKTIEESDGSIFQNDLISKTEFSKVKVSRILDRLETKGLVERRRRGMSNIVVLK